MSQRRLRSGLALAALVLGGCALADAPIIDPAGPVTRAGRDLLFHAFAIMMVVVLPVFALTAWVIWRYRASHPRSAYRPDWDSRGVDAVTWIVPAAVVVALGTDVWRDTHALDPYRRLPGAPFEVQAVAQDWKWLFLYPEAGVAAVNELAFPAGRPLVLSITSDTVMNAFFIPALGSQIYAMPGMRTELNLRADAPGRFVGRNAQYSGRGFPDQHFAALALTDGDFASWIERARAAPPLDAAAYASLARPSASHHPVAYWGAFPPDLFATVIARYAGGHRLMLGRLSAEALPLYSAIALGGALVTVGGALAAGALVTWLGAWGHLWRAWLTNVDHKRIGIMYVTLALVMLVRGFIDALMMRAQQAIASGNEGYLPPEHFDQIFSSHGTIMIFFMAMPFLTGLINFVAPLQIGARDMAFPYLNAASLWLTGAGAALVMASLVIGRFSTAGWTGYPPYSGAAANPYVGVDYWIGRCWSPASARR